eukprot:6173761-Pleurochrysis_carterae.AAC.1
MSRFLGLLAGLALAAELLHVLRQRVPPPGPVGGRRNARIPPLAVAAMLVVVALELPARFGFR